jgi:hypothetical protein
MGVREVRPWEIALREEVDLPSGVAGPVENWALARLASRLAGESAGVMRLVFSFHCILVDLSIRDSDDASRIIAAVNTAIPRNMLSISDYSDSWI